VVVSSGSLGGGSRGGGLLGGARRRRSRGANGRGRRRCGRLLDVFVRWLPNAGLVERYRLVPSVGIDAGGGRGGGGLAPRGISWGGFARGGRRHRRCGLDGTLRAAR